jgi:outer membrane protein OmpA-like peptidoglycan-associated protein
MFITVLYIDSVKVEMEENEDLLVKIDDLSSKKYKLKDELYKDLVDSFGRYKNSWGIEIDKDNLSISFKSPEVLFKQGSDELSVRFKSIIRVFFPKLVKVLSKYRSSISEIRIEGHTSSEWDDNTGFLNAYINNMELSQDRTRKVLKTCLLQNNSKWVLKRLTANGLSSSRAIVKNGVEDEEASRRVVFRITTLDAEIIDNIRRSIKNAGNTK